MRAKKKERKVVDVNVFLVCMCYENTCELKEGKKGRNCITKQGDLIVNDRRKCANLISKENFPPFFRTYCTVQCERAPFLSIIICTFFMCTFSTVAAGLGSSATASGK